MAVPTNLSEALALLTASSGNKISGLDVREVVTWLASAGISEEQVETLIATAASAAEAQTTAYRSQATWYIDPAGGDDDADGLTAETAIASQAEWMRRTGGEPLVAMTVNVLSDSDEDMVWRVKNTPETLVTVVGAKSAPLYTGTVSAVQNHSSSQNIEGWLTDSALPAATWAASGLLGKIVVLTSGTFTGFHYWMCSDMPTERTARFSRVNNGQGAMLQGTVQVGVTYTVHDLRTLSGKHVIEGGSIKFVDLELGSSGGGADQVRISGGDITVQNAKLLFPRVEFGARVQAHSSWLQDSGSTGVGVYDTADLAIFYTHATNGLTVHGSGRFYSHSLTTHGKVVLAGIGARLYVTNSCGFFDCTNALEMGAMTEASIMGRFWGTNVTGVGVTMATTAKLVTLYPITIATPTTQVTVGGVPKLYSDLLLSADAQRTAWRNQAVWYIDPVSGNDINTGLTSGTALATQAEWLRRTGGEPLVAMTITFLSDSSEDMAWHVTNTPETGVTVTGTVTTLYSGTATSATTWSSGSLRDGKITDTAAPSTFTAAGLVGKLVTLTSGALTGFKCWVWKDLEPTLATRTWRTTRVTNPTTGEVRADFTAGTSYTISDIVTLSGSHDIRGYVTFDSLELGDEGGAAHQHRVSAGSPTFQSCKLHGMDFHGASHPAMRATWFSKGLDGGLYDNSIVTTHGMHFADGLTVRHAAQLHAFSTSSAAKFVVTDYGHLRIVSGGTCAWYECVNGLELGPLTSVNASGARIWGVDVTGVGLTIGASARLVIGAGFPVSIGAATVTTQVSIGGVTKLYSELPTASPGDPTPYTSPTNLATITLDL